MSQLQQFCILTDIKSVVQSASVWACAVDVAGAVTGTVLL